MKRKMVGSNSKPYQFHPIFLLLLLLIILHCHDSEAQSPIQPMQPIPSHRRSLGWDPSMAIFIGSLVGSFILVVVISAFLRRCAESCLTHDQQGNNTEWPCSCSHGGIDPETLDTFPTLLYSAVKDLRICKDGVPDAPLECAVCLGEFTDDDTLRLLPHCNHVFHPPCIDAWLSSHVTCPVCRANLNLDPAEVAISVTTTQLIGVENDGEGSRNGAEQSIAGGSEIEGFPAVREASEGRGNGEEDKGVRERASKSKLSGKRMVYARSNTTGHSVVEAGECVERYTLRLPEDVRKYILLNHVMAVQRSASFNVAVSGKKGLRWSDSEGGSSRGKRNSFGMREGKNVK